MDRKDMTDILTFMIIYTAAFGVFYLAAVNFISM